MEQSFSAGRIGTVGVVGLGLLGRSIAACLLAHGFRVIGFSRRRETRDQARHYIETAIHDLVERARFSNALLADWLRRYREVDSLQFFNSCDFVIESVLEDPATKQAVFDEIEANVRSCVPIASNTSAIPITQLQASRRCPERFVGMHWAEPAHVTRFMEIIRGQLTSEQTLRRAVELAERLGKEPSLVQKDVPGFVANRLAYAMYREALHLLEAGVADAETIDRSFRNAVGLWATLVGPLRWIDLTGGPALYARAMEGVLPVLDNTRELPQTIRKLAEQGAKGIANGQGFFQYTEEQAKRWEALFTRHAWKVRQLVDEYFPEEEGDSVPDNNFDDF